MARARLTAAVAAVAAVGMVTGCGVDTPDYQSIWTSTTATSTPPKKPIALYLEDEGVSGVPMTPAILTELAVSIPTPPGWAAVTDNTLPSAFTLLRRSPPPPGGYTPQALLMVFKLSGDFDVAEALSHGFADAEISEQFNRVAASTDDVDGYPAATIQGTYIANRARLQSFNRLVIPTTPAGQRFLVQLTITTAVDQAAAEGPAIDAMISGFSVAAT